MISLALLAMLAAVQGQALQLAQPHEAGLSAIDVSWDDRRIPYVRVEGGWFTVIGIGMKQVQVYTEK